MSVVHPFVVMTRTTPLCTWEGSIVLNATRQRRWHSTRLATGIAGFHSRASKANFINWLAHSNYTHAWHVEDDACLHQAHPDEIMRAYADSPADIVAVPWTRQVGGWVERQCNVCTRENVVKFAWPIARLSRRLAREVLASVHAGARGHHEVLVGTLCRQRAWCLADIQKGHGFVGEIAAVGGGRSKKYLEMKSPIRGRVYHPVRRCDSVVREG